MASKKNHKVQPEPIMLALFLCAACNLEHPKPKGVAGDGFPFLTVSELGKFYGLAASTVYSMKSKDLLPPTIPGRKSPAWDPCVAARFLYGVKEGER